MCQNAHLKVSDTVAALCQNQNTPCYLHGCSPFWHWICSGMKAFLQGDLAAEHKGALASIAQFADELVTTVTTALCK